jgi:hypothetical protein
MIVPAPVTDHAYDTIPAGPEHVLLAPGQTEGRVQLIEQTGEALTETILSHWIPPPPDVIVTCRSYVPPVPEFTITDEPLVAPEKLAPEPFDMKDQL